jgi:hypothetical protein
MNTTCAGLIRRRAAARGNHSARSTSGKSRMVPERGGHSIVNVLLLTRAVSKSPSAAHAVTSLPAMELAEIAERCADDYRGGPRRRGTRPRRATSVTA